jgi:4'-phosphopantetheinyl transferase
MPAAEPCRVFWASPVDPERAPGLRALLDADEQGRLDRFRRTADRARYLAAHALVRLVLAPMVGDAPAALRFDRRCRCGAQHGKPTHPGGPHFSLTHGGDLVGVAVCRAGGPIGVDVEPVRELTDLAGMVGHVCSPTELHRGPAPTATAFFTLWTRKEALLKATGDGIVAPMSGITLGPDGVQSWVGEGAPGGPVWVRDLHPEPGHRAAVAGLGEHPDTVLELDGRPLLAAAS